MSEETQETNDGSWSSLKKTIIGAIATAVTAGGAYFTSKIFGGGDEEKPKTEVAAPAPVINLNVDNSSKNTSTSGGGGNTTVIKEKTTVVEKAAPAESKPVKKSETEDAPW